MEAWKYCWGTVGTVYTQKKHKITFVVIVNNDQQVKLKNSIPFLPEDVRVKIIQSLDIVDSTTLSIDDTESIEKTLEYLAYDYEDFNEKIYFVNSGDRQKSHPKEHEICEKHGIEEVFLDLPKINSSGEILDNVGKEWLKRKQNDEQN